MTQQHDRRPHTLVASLYPYGLKAEPGRCTFLVRPEWSDPADLHPCNRTKEYHPVVRMGKWENHMYMLDEKGNRVT